MHLKTKFLFLVTFLLTFLAPATQAQEIITLTEDNLLVLSEAVSSESVGKLIIKARKLDELYDYRALISRRSKPIYLFLNTPGGDIRSGMELIEALKGLKRPVHTVSLFAASMGFQIVQHLQDRLTLNSGILMSHQAHGGVQGDFSPLKPNQLHNRLEMWTSIIEEMDKTTVARTNGKQTLESYQKSYVPELWLTGTQAVTEGYADRVVNIHCDPSLSGTEKKSTLYMGIQVNYAVDKCPINTGILDVEMQLPTTQGYMPISEFVSKGGQFGSSCLLNASSSVNHLCALDTSLNFEKLSEFQDEFNDVMSFNRRHTLPLSF